MFTGPQFALVKARGAQTLVEVQCAELNERIVKKAEALVVRILEQVARPWRRLILFTVASSSSQRRLVVSSSSASFSTATRPPRSPLNMSCCTPLVAARGGHAQGQRQHLPGDDGTISSHRHPLIVILSSSFSHLISSSGAGRRPSLWPPPHHLPRLVFPRSRE